MAADDAGKSRLVQWILDTRDLWAEATATAQLKTVASDALALLTPDEQASVLRFYHARDAKVALGSHLLKRLAAAKLCAVPWAEARITRDGPNGKPTFRPRGGRPVPALAFNVSHQAGLVVLVAAAPGSSAAEAEVGVDVVCTSERRARDHEMVAREGRADGWPRFVDMHAEVLAPAEAAFLKWRLPGLGKHAAAGRDDAAAAAGALDGRLRAFYALWCLREAYVKMTGDALLADWLADLEFRGFRPPRAKGEEEETGNRNGDGDEGGGGTSGGGGLDAGEILTGLEMWFRGKRVEDVNIALRALGTDYMVCTAVRTPGREEEALAYDVGEFEFLKLDDILDFAGS